MKIMLFAVTLERVFLESYALLPKLFSTSSKKQFACLHSLLDFFQLPPNNSAVAAARRRTPESLNILCYLRYSLLDVPAMILCAAANWQCAQYTCEHTHTHSIFLSFPILVFKIHIS